jgi:ABC-type branched-subunit amino acid transport system substrate-binding protein
MSAAQIPRMVAAVWIIAQSITAVADASGIIGYGSSTAVVTAKIQETFYMGFELGFEDVLGHKKASELLAVKQVSDGSQQGATRSAEYLIQNGVIALLGFPSSHDSLLAADIAQKNKMFALFTGSGHSDLALKGPTVFTTGASMDKAVESIIRFAQRILPAKRGMVLINPYAVFSMNHETVVHKFMHDKVFPGVEVETVRLNKELMLNEDDIKALKAGKYGYVFLTPYPEELAPLMNQLSENKIDVPMIASSSWGTAEPDIMTRFVSMKKTPFYVGTEWVRGQAESRHFERLARLRYGKDPGSEMSYGYDVGVIAATVIARVKGPLTKESIVRSFKEQPCFKHVTVGEICFGPNGGHAIRPLRIQRLTKSGRVLVKDEPGDGK